MPTVGDPHERRRRERAQRAKAKATEYTDALAARRAALPREEPRPGFWLVRMVKGGPLVAACIRLVETTAEPGNSENAMTGTRSPHLAAFVLDEPVAMDRVWHWRLEEISKAEYRFQCADAVWARKHSPLEPIANPSRKVDLTQLPTPFLGTSKPMADITKRDYELAREACRNYACNEAFIFGEVAAAISVARTEERARCRKIVLDERERHRDRGCRNACMAIANEIGN